MGPLTLDSIGWTFPLGAALIVVGLVLLALIDAPRRLLWRIRRFRGLSQRPPSGPPPDDGALADDPGTWVSPPPQPTFHAEAAIAGHEDAVWQEHPVPEAADVDRATTSDPGGVPGDHQEPVEPGLDPAAQQERPSE